MEPIPTPITSSTNGASFSCLSKLAVQFVERSNVFPIDVANFLLQYCGNNIVTKK